MLDMVRIFLGRFVHKPTFLRVLGCLFLKATAAKLLKIWVCGSMLRKKHEFWATNQGIELQYPANYGFEAHGCA